MSNTPIATLSIDEIAVAFGYLSWKEILNARACKKFREAATQTLVPHTSVSGEERDGLVPEFYVNSSRRYNALTWISKALPNLQQISLYHIRFEDGDGPNIEARGPDHLQQGPNIPAHRFDILASFKKLTKIDIVDVDLNGYYPVLFGFQYLEELKVYSTEKLTCNLQMISEGLPLLKVLNWTNSPCLEGDVKSLRAIKNTLQSVFIVNCNKVKGDFMRLSDFPNLEQLDLSQTSVVGDFSRVKDGHFSKIKYLDLPKECFSLDQVDDAAVVMQVSCCLMRTNGARIGEHRYPWILSNNSSDYYPMDIFSLLEPPFHVQTVKAGSRIGWRWTNGRAYGSCETNWVDPEPVKEDSDYYKYMREMKSLQADVESFRGFFKPPTLEEYQRLTTHW